MSFESDCLHVLHPDSLRLAQAQARDLSMPSLSQPPTISVAFTLTHNAPLDVVHGPTSVPRGIARGSSKNAGSSMQSSKWYAGQGAVNLPQSFRLHRILCQSASRLSTESKPSRGHGIHFLELAGASCRIARAHHHQSWPFVRVIALLVGYIRAASWRPEKNGSG